MAKNSKKGIFIVNLGTPDSPSTGDVRKYLREFLMDGRVIDIPFWNRWMLVNLIIAPLRAPKSAKIYKEVWTDKGSPLLLYGEEVRDKLQEELGNDYIVSLGMRYQNPSIESAMEVFKNEPVDEIIVIPMYPQYASATTGSTIEKINEVMSDWQVIPTMKYVGQFHKNEEFLDVFARLGRKYLEAQSYDHVIFSYHGLPERQILKSTKKGYCQLSDKCCSHATGANQYCYRSQCFHSSFDLAEKLGLKKEDYTICFQSRLGKTPWIKPYTEDVIKQLAEEGKKKVLAFSPAFVADCLETIVEIADEYQELFEEHGGEKIQLVESLNGEDDWIACLKNMVHEYEGV